MRVEANLLFALSVILGSPVYIIILFTLSNVPWVSFFVFTLCSLRFYADIIAEKKTFCLAFVLAISF